MFPSRGKLSFETGKGLHLAVQANDIFGSMRSFGLVATDRDGNVTAWSRGAQLLTGYPSAEIVGASLSRICDLDAEAVQQTLSQSLEHDGVEIECMCVRQDQSEFCSAFAIEPVFNSDGTHTGFAASVRDITERRTTEDALRQSEQRFRLLVQGVTDYAIYMLDPSGRVSSWNAGAERFKGYAASEIVGEHFSRFYTQEDLDKGIPALALRTAAEDGRFEAEGWRLRKDGSRFWANVVIDPIRSEDNGRLLGFTKITRDLTERKKAQEELDASREQLFHSQRLESIGRLTGGIAHDFNNILMAILSSLRLAQDRAVSGQNIDSFVMNAIEAAERGAMLTQRMLAFARKQQLSIQPVDLVTTLREMSSLLEKALDPNITVKLELPLRVPHVLADGAQLEIAIMNLAVNAGDSMPSGGTLTIALRTDRSGGEPDMVTLSVSDEGEGMDEATLSRAVEPFFTTKGIGKGTGLGLSMVEGVAEQCGGHFDLHSTPGEGTTAELHLPVAKTGIPVADEGSVSRAPSPTEAIRILAVDDDAIILLNTVTILEDLGHQVFEASSGAQALQVLESQPVDLLLTDYAMPGMNGGELAAKARALRPEIRIIIASGYADISEEDTRGLPRLTKPFDDSQLDEAIRAAVVH